MSNKIIVGIPCHNSAETVANLLESLTNQNYDNFEVWVALDACTDNTADIIQGYTGRLACRLFNCAFRSPADARQLLLDEAPAHSYIYWADSDDEVVPGTFRRQLKVMRDYDAPAVWGRMIFLDECGRDISSAQHFETNYFSWVAGALYNVDYLRRRGIVFPAGLRYKEDVIFNYRLLAAGLHDYSKFRFHLLGTPGYIHKARAESLTAQKKDFAAGELQAWRVDAFTPFREDVRRDEYFLAVIEAILLDYFAMMQSANEFHFNRALILQNFATRLKFWRISSGVAQWALENKKIIEVSEEERLKLYALIDYILELV